jgi:protein-arginine kinase activator protein McsA
LVQQKICKNCGKNKTHPIYDAVINGYCFACWELHEKGEITIKFICEHCEKEFKAFFAFITFCPKCWSDYCEESEDIYQRDAAATTGSGRIVAEKRP